MINKIINLFRASVGYTINHPQILFIFTLLIFLPFLFLYTGQQFLDAGRENQDRLQKDKVGLMHDAFSSLLTATNFNTEIAKTELTKITLQNPDITDYKVATHKNSHIVPFIAMIDTDIDKPVADESFYINSALRTDESLIFEFSENGERTWSAYRAIRSNDNQVYFYNINYKFIDY